MARRMADLTEEEFIEAARRAMPRFLEAQRIAAPLYAEQFGLEADMVIPPEAPPWEPGVVVVANFGNFPHEGLSREEREDEIEVRRAAGSVANQFPKTYILPPSWAAIDIELSFVFKDGGWRIAVSPSSVTIELWLWRRDTLALPFPVQVGAVAVELPEEIELGAITGISLRIL